MGRSNMVYKKSENEIGPLPTAREMSDAQGSGLLCQNLKEVLKKGGTITVTDDELLY